MLPNVWFEREPCDDAVIGVVILICISSLLFNAPTWSTAVVVVNYVCISKLRRAGLDPRRNGKGFVIEEFAEIDVLVSAIETKSVSDFAEPAALSRTAERGNVAV